MDARVEEVGPCKKRITVQIPADEVKTKFDEGYENLRKGLDLPGFRRGHVPRTLLERRFGEDVAKDVRRDLLQESYDKVIDENDLDVVGAPDFKEDELQDLSIEQSFSYTLDVEVKPVFDLPDYSALKLQKTATEPTPLEINERLDHYLQRMATYETKEGPAASEDLLNSEAELRTGDEVIWKREQYSVKADDERLLGIKIENLSAELTGCVAGDEKSFNVTLPDDFPIERYRGKDATVVLKVKEVRKFHLPEATDEWAAELGFDSLDELNEELSTQIRRSKEAASREGMKRQIRDQLAETVEMEMPENLIKRVLDEERERVKMRLEERAQQDEELRARLDEEIEKETAEAEKESVKNVKLYFIMGAIAKRETVLVTEDELRARSDQMAGLYRMDADAFWDTISSGGRLETLRRDMVDDKVFDLLISKASVTDAPPASAAPEGENA